MSPSREHRDDVPVPPRAGGGATRPRIRGSWTRSRLSGVNPTAGTLAAAVADVDVHPELARVATPVLDRLEESLAGTGWMVVLSDHGGRLTRLGGARSAVRTGFERVGACPGAGASEAQIGTNAIGTALEEGRPIVVVGAEHYQEGFERVSCGAAVVRHPVNRRPVGALALAALDAAPGRELLALVTGAARELERGLLERASAGDRLVLEALKTRGRGTSRSVVGITREVMMANDPGVRLLPRLDQASLWERARETVESGHERWVDVALNADAATVRVRCTPVRHVDQTVGALLDFGRIKLDPACGEVPPRREPPVRRPDSGSPPASRPPVSLAQASPAPAPVATAPVYDCPSQQARALRDQIVAVAPDATAVLVSGEAGSGKLTVALRLLEIRVPGAEPTVVPCWEPEAVARLVASAPSGPVILAHIEELDRPTSYRLRDYVRRVAGTATSLVATANSGPRSPGTDNPLVDALAGARIDVPALRYRRDDIGYLAERFAAGDGRHRRLLPEATQLLLRYPWPGNIRELHGVVRGAAAASRAGIGLEHLPASLRRLATRRPLSPLEQAEADAILAALRACDNNKVQAASLLQISRSRLYRKASAYGLAGTILD